MVSREDVICEKGILKSIKKVLPSHENMVLILDDRIDVWNNIENLINIKPFFFFNKEDKNEIRINDEKSFNNYDDDDYCLYSVTLLLKFIHNAYFSYHSKFKSICDIRYLKKHKMNMIFKNLIAAYIDEPLLNLNETYEFNTIKNLGGILENRISVNTNVVITNYSSNIIEEMLSMYNNENFNKNYYVLNKTWIHFCEIFLCDLKKEDFIYKNFKNHSYYSQKNIFSLNKERIDEFFSIDTITLNNFLDDIRCKYY